MIEKSVHETSLLRLIEAAGMRRIISEENQTADGREPLDDSGVPFGLSPYHFYIHLQIGGDMHYVPDCLQPGRGSVKNQRSLD